MRAAIAHWYAKALGRTEHHVGAHFTGRGQQQQAQQVGSHAGQGLLGVQVVDQGPQITNLAVGVGVLQQRTEHLVLGQVIHSVDNQFEAKPLGPRLHHGNSLRMTVFVDEEQIAFRLGHTLGQGHGFRRRRGFIEQRSVGQLQACQVDGQLLEVEQGLEPALGDFRLVRGVGRIPTGVFQHITQDHGGRQGAVVAHPNQAGPDLILFSITAQFGQGAQLVQGRRQVQRPIQANAWRYCLLDQLDPATKPETVEHGLLFGGVWPQVAAQEGIGIA